MDDPDDDRAEAMNEEDGPGSLRMYGLKGKRSRIAAQ
jgi:hypothetical protein